MSNFEDQIKVLRNWRENASKTLLAVLERLNQTKSFRQMNLEDFLKIVSDFHKQICQAEDSEVQPKWFQQAIALKKKIKKQQEDLEKEKRQKNKEKKPINIKYPKALTQDRKPGDHLFLQHIYKSFVTNFEAAADSPTLVSFVRTLLNQVKYLFSDLSQDQMNKRISSICIRLARKGSLQSKGRMLRGEVTPKQLATDDEELYFDKKTKQVLEQYRQDAFEACQAGFYEEMRKQSHKDACLPCKFCPQKKAYCQDMKQIRCSDQPMTLFMRCNACDRTWCD